MSVIVPLGWPVRLGKQRFLSIVLVVGGFLAVAVSRGLTSGFFRESESLSAFLNGLRNLWLDPMGTCPSAGICVRRPLDPE